MSTFHKDLIDCYTKDNFYKTQRLNPLVFQYTQGITGKALDLGAGKGVNSKYLSDRGFEVTAVEINPEAIKMIQRQGIDPQWEDIRELMWSRENHYNVILCLYVFQHLEDDDIIKVVEQMKCSLKKEGIMIISSFKVQSNRFSLGNLAHLFCEDHKFKIFVKDNWKRMDVSHGNLHYHEGFYLGAKKTCV